jgi:hypothetical protein
VVPNPWDVPPCDENPEFLGERKKNWEEQNEDNQRTRKDNRQKKVKLSL